MVHLVAAESDWVLAIVGAGSVKYTTQSLARFEKSFAIVLAMLVTVFKSRGDFSLMSKNPLSHPHVVFKDLLA